ncbi:MAG: PTS sugar transporter subunit IIA [Kiritimatiellae bacterium]|nr:PTS sugar transporter subunit IIA [Kiritimatiellia bacterium]
MPHRTLGIREAAEYLHVSEDEVRQLIRAGEIPCEQTGGRVVFRRAHLDGWASRRVLGLAPPRLRALEQDVRQRRAARGDAALRVTDLLGAARVEPALDARTQPSVLRELSLFAARTGLVTDAVALLSSLEAREAAGSTALAGGVAVPHPEHHREWLFAESFVLLARTRQPVPFGGPDGGLTDIFFLLALDDPSLHLPVLARVCAICHHTDLLTWLREAASAGEMLDAVRRAEEELLRAG